MHQRLVEVVAPVCVEECPDSDLMSGVWKAFGVPADLVSFLSEECRLRWKPESVKLEVLDVDLQSASSITHLSHALLSYEHLFRRIRASGHIGEYAGGPGDRLDRQSERFPLS
eukprot:6092405-Amphidinium_carterae.2